MDVPPPLTGYATPGHGIAPADHPLALPGCWAACLGLLWHGYARGPGGRARGTVR
ncbi:hypothetical protein [Streptomyces djakartensis]|uniref:hypothetical protein n=1 Tax=Streptomyces djakartensis TaxID=68193 RepID=UPI0034DE300A